MGPRLTFLFQRFCLTLMVLGWLGAASASTLNIHEKQQVQRLIALVDYLGGDYSGAVQQGKVVSATEYAEMKNFSQAIAERYQTLSPRIADPSIAQSLQANVLALQSLIEVKADASAVHAVTKALRADLLVMSGLETTPAHLLDFQAARTSYEGNCVSCHGDRGMGNGPAARSMSPPPRNFHDQDVMEAGSPLKFFNILPLGVEGTAMPAFSELSSQERWGLAFYLSALRHLPAGAEVDFRPESQWSHLKTSDRARLQASGVDLAFLAKTSDEDLRRWAAQTLKVSDADAVLRVLRTAVPFQQKTPAVVARIDGKQSSDPQSYLRNSAHQLDQARDLLAQGHVSEAKDHILDAYLNGLEPTEPLLRTIKTVDVAQLEKLFLEAQASLDHRSGSRPFDEVLQDLKKGLESAGALLEKSSGMSGYWAVFLSSALIIFREGLEAFLIVAAVLKLLDNIGATRAKRWIHLGWLSAIGAGGLTYYFFSTLITRSGAHREMVEGVTTAAAAIVLFYVSYWLLSQSEKRSWERFIKSHTSAILSSGKLGALFGLSFVAVYREAAETALFYQALGSGTANSPWALGLGLLAGIVSLSALCFGMMRYSGRLSLRRFFMVTSIAMMALSIVLAGKAVHACVEAGLFRATLLNSVPRVDLLGIYPLLESLMAQIALTLLAIVVALWIKLRKSVLQPL